MSTRFFLAATVVAAIAMTAAVSSRSAVLSTDISGTWQLSVDLETGGHGDPKFVFKQDKDTLTGSYDGPLGQYKVAGTVKDNKAVFGFEFTQDGQTIKATYTGTIESPTKMSGTVTFADGPTGKWTGSKQ